MSTMSNDMASGTDDFFESELRGLKIPANSVLGNYDSMKIRRDGNSNLYYYDDTFSYDIRPPRSFLADLPLVYRSGTASYYPDSVTYPAQVDYHVQPVVQSVVTPRVTPIITNHITPIVK